MTDSYQELVVYIDRLELYIAGVVALFVISLIATAWLLFADKGEDDE